MAWLDDGEVAYEAYNVPESPDYDEDAVAATGGNFMVVVPWSGGLDSTTAAAMAVEAGLPVTLLAATGGQPWDNAEARARTFVSKAIPGLAEIDRIDVNLPPSPAVYEHIHVGRNVQIAEAAAAVFRDGVTWGEVWLGWLGGEIPLSGGDKSRATLINLDVLAPPYVRFVTPLATMTKADCVAWWKDRGHVGQAAATYSCFGPGPLQCGQCRACFRTFVAFAANGDEGMLRWLHRALLDPAGFDGWCAHYETKEEGSHYTGRRLDQTRRAIARWKEYADG